VAKLPLTSRRASRQSGHNPVRNYRQSAWRTVPRNPGGSIQVEAELAPATFCKQHVALRWPRLAP